MTGTLSSEVIIFAIHSAIRLGNSFEKAYAASLKSKRIVLPLPSVKPGAEFITIQDFFENLGKEFVDQIPTLKTLHDLAGQGEHGMSQEQLQKYEAYYRRCAGIVLRPKSQLMGKPPISPQGLIYLLTIRQWQKDGPDKVKPLQLMAGTLVEIGIDYFNQVPGAIRSDSAYANVLRSFLQGVDKVKFSDNGSFKDKIVQDVVPELFISVAENIDSLSSEFINDKKLLEFVQATTTGLTRDLYKRIEELGNSASREDRKEVVNWGKLVFTSLIKNSGEYVFNAPDKVFGSDSAQSALIQSVGKSLMSAILEKPLDEDLSSGETPAPSGLNLKNIFTIETLDKVVQSSLTVVAQYPDLISGKKGIREIVVQLAETVAKSGIKQPGLVPELVRMVLANTAGHLEQLWDVKDDSAKHLLITTVQQLLDALSTPTDGTWRPRLTNQQILIIAENSFSEVIKNQAWINVTAEGSKSPLLAEVISTTFTALGAIPEGKRLSFETMEKLIKINLQAVATSQLVLKKIPFGTQAENKSILNNAMNMVLNRVFKEDKNTGDPVLFLFDLLEYIMDTVVTKHPDNKGLILTQLLLNANSGVILENGFDRELANELLKVSLDVIAANPDLIANDAALQNIITGVAVNFKNAGINQPGLLGEFIRITLLQASGQLNLMVKDSSGNPKHLFVLATKYILEGLTAKPNSGKWKPKLSGPQMLGLSEVLLAEVVRNPNWVTDKVNQETLLQQVLDIIFRIFNKYPEGQRVNFETLKEIIEQALRAVALNKLILRAEPQKEAILTQAMDLVFEFVYNEPATVDKSELLVDVLDYVLGVVISDHPNDEGLVIIMSLLKKELGIVSSTGLNEDLANRLVVSSLNALAEHPELVADKSGIQNIIVGVSTALTEFKEKNEEIKITDPAIVSEFIRLILENTAGNLNLIIDTSKHKQKNILVLALQQVLKAISKRPSSGKWKPKLTPVQILQITEMILDRILENPLWVKNDWIQVLIELVYQSMEQVPKDQPLNFSTIETLIDEAIKTANTRVNLIVKKVTDEDGNEKLVLCYALEGLFAALFDESDGTIGTWTLTQSETLNTIIIYYLSFLTGQTVDKDGMDQAIEKIKKAIKDLNNEVLFDVEDLLESLNAKIKDIDIA